MFNRGESIIEVLNKKKYFIAENALKTFWPKMAAILSGLIELK